MTLVELMVAASVMSLVAVTLGGLVQAVNTARTYISAMQLASSQGQFTTDRIKSAMQRSGTYRVGSSSTIAGIAVVWNSDRPETLVVWTGGREESLSDQGTLHRLPLANEIVIYTPDPDRAERLVEIVVPSASGTIDFAASDFETRVRQLIANSDPDQRVTLCDRVRVAADGTGKIAAIRFEMEQSPDNSAISTTAPGTVNWRSLQWYGGISSSSAGLRHVLVRIEMQVLTDGTPGDPASDIAMPVFGSASRRYFFERG
jgi:Tfp pilus assembly major pilin PilA